jgi:hypothetical protein
MSNYTRPLNKQDYKTLTLAALGGALEFYDFIIFVFFAAVVGELFFRQISRNGCVRCRRLAFLLRVIWRVRWAAS